MNNRKSDYSKKYKQLSLLYMIVGAFLIVGNVVMFLMEGKGEFTYISTLTGVLFLMTGIIFKVRGSRNAANDS